MYQLLFIENRKNMSSKKIISLQKKVREKINSIHEQKNILTAVVDSFVSEVGEGCIFVRQLVPQNSWLLCLSDSYIYTYTLT
jgi:hypothetical protein